MPWSHIFYGNCKFCNVFANSATFLQILRVGLQILRVRLQKKVVGSLASKVCETGSRYRCFILHETWYLFHAIRLIRVIPVRFILSLRPNG